jgi:D-beta-D-heptose 7-phosphate kinase/D-beta-D-heptose 1-phosphate adenosyltransferase
MKIAVIGDLITDQYIYGTVERISPEAPVPILKFSQSKISSGGAGNVFQNIKSLTSDVVLCSSSNDIPIKTRFIADSHYLFRMDQESDSIKWSIDTSFINADIVVVSDYAKGCITVEVLNQLKNKISIIDPKRNLEFYKGMWCVKPNKKEFENTVGKWSSLNELELLMRFAKLEYNFTHLIVTLGAEGVAYYGPEGFVHINSEAKEVFDVTGAGDTFTAVLAYAICKDYTMLDAIKLANKAASIAVSHNGTYVIKLEDLNLTNNSNIIFTNGCFDILHPGHIKLLNECKKLGKVIVGLNSDSSVKRLKGPLRPINSQEHRKAMLEALGFEVQIFEEDTPIELIIKLKPSIIVKGGDYKKEEVVGHTLANVIMVPYDKGFSTTSIIESIKNDKT